MTDFSLWHCFQIAVSVSNLNFNDDDRKMVERYIPKTYQSEVTTEKEEEEEITSRHHTSDKKEKQDLEQRKRDISSVRNKIKSDLQGDESLDGQNKIQYDTSVTKQDQVVNNIDKNDGSQKQTAGNTDINHDEQIVNIEVSGFLGETQKKSSACEIL